VPSMSRPTSMVPEYRARRTGCAGCLHLERTFGYAPWTRMLLPFGAMNRIRGRGATARAAATVGAGRRPAGLDAAAIPCVGAEADANATTARASQRVRRPPTGDLRSKHGIQLLPDVLGGD